MMMTRENAPSTMTTSEKVLYHQIHPLKLAADISASIVSGYFVWQHELLVAMISAFTPAIIASLLIMRFADLEWLKESRLGHYIRRTMTRAIEAWRFSGQIVMWFGAWYHSWAAILLGALLVLAAWSFGAVRFAKTAA
jgi:hypothetical protein